MINIAMTLRSKRCLNFFYVDQHSIPAQTVCLYYNVQSLFDSCSSCTLGLRDNFVAFSWTFFLLRTERSFCFLQLMGLSVLLSYWLIRFSTGIALVPLIVLLNHFNASANLVCLCFSRSNFVRFPLYYHMKFAFLVWLQLPTTDVS